MQLLVKFSEISDTSASKFSECKGPALG